MLVRLTTGESQLTERRQHAIWVTNMAAPYRRPVWKALTADLDLTVALLNSDEQFHRTQKQGNRGPEWAARNLNDIDIRSLSTQNPRIAGRQVFFLKTFPKSLVRPTTNSILLGGWEQPAYWQLRLVARLRGLRAVGFYESTLLTARYQRGPVALARKVFLRSLDAIVVPGIAAAESLYTIGVDPQRVYVGFNAVELDLFVRREMTSDDNVHDHAVGHRFLHVGQLVARKNVDGLIRAFAAMADPEDHLTIAGKGPQGEALKQLADDLGVGSQVSFLGLTPYEQIPGLMHDHHTLVLASKEEVWGLVVNEALAAGLHAVVSEVSGIAPSIRGMRGVWVANVADESIAASMVASRAGWSGPLPDPEILAYTPDRFASVFKSALLGADPEPVVSRREDNEGSTGHTTQRRGDL